LVLLLQPSTNQGHFDVVGLPAGIEICGYIASKFKGKYERNAVISHMKLLSQKGSCFLYYQNNIEDKSLLGVINYYGELFVPQNIEISMIV